MKIHAVEIGGTVHAADERRPGETLCGREHVANPGAAALPEATGEDLDRVECEECREALQAQLEDSEFGY